jgi:hypothetical protein
VVYIKDNIFTFIIPSSIGRCICALQGSDALVKFDYMLELYKDDKERTRFYKQIFSWSPKLTNDCD